MLRCAGFAASDCVIIAPGFAHAAHLSIRSENTLADALCFFKVLRGNDSVGEHINRTAGSIPSAKYA